MLWGKHGTTPVYGVIIDVHSGSVGIAIVCSDPLQVSPKIIYSHREYIKILEHPDTATMVRALRHALFAATLQFSETGIQKLKDYDPHARIVRILLVCGAPWAHTATRLLHIVEKEPFRITHERIGALVEAAEKRDEEELRTTTLLRELNIRLVEHAIVSTAVNGYPVHDPYGTEGTELSLAHISGLIPQAIIDEVVNIEEKILLHTTRTTHTFALILFCVLRDLYPHTKNALTIDISGEATELSIMQDEVLLETHVFPWGGNTFVRELAKKIGTFPEEALTHIREHSPTAPEAIRLAISKTSEEYGVLLQSALVTLSEKYIIPKHIYIIAGKQLDHFFEKIVHQTALAYLGTHGTITVLADTLVQTEQSAIEHDIFSTLEARFFHKLHGCGEVH